MKHRSLRIKITRSGWLFILLCLGIGASALNTGNNLLYLIFGMMLSFLILSGLLSNNSLSRLRISAQFPRRIFAKQETTLHLELQNRKKLFPSFAISLFPVHQTSKKRTGAFVVKIPAKETISTTETIRFPKRGKVKLPTFSAQTAFPFGLIQKSISIPSAGETIVYPYITEIEPLLRKHRRFIGEYLSGERGGSANPYGIRDYVEGDPARFIHWKSSAKLQKWKIKEFEKEKRLRILLDVFLKSKTDSNAQYLEKVLSMAASIVTYLYKRDIEVNLRMNGEMIDPIGRGYLDTYLTTLALASPPEKTTRSIATETEHTIVVGDFPAGQLKGDLVIGLEQLETIPALH